MIRKLKFYFIGLIPGIILVGFILNKKGANCSGYLPNSRVIAETLSKKFYYTEQAKLAMAKMKFDEELLKDSIITLGKINFDQSQAQLKPCPKYQLYRKTKYLQYKVQFTKCKEQVTIESIELEK